MSKPLTSNQGSSEGERERENRSTSSINQKYIDLVWLSFGFYLTNRLVKQPTRQVLRDCPAGIHTRTHPHTKLHIQIQTRAVLNLWLPHLSWKTLLPYSVYLIGCPNGLTSRPIILIGVARKWPTDILYKGWRETCHSWEQALEWKSVPRWCFQFLSFLLPFVSPLIDTRLTLTEFQWHEHDKTLEDKRAYRIDSDSHLLSTFIIIIKLSFSSFR